MKKAKQTQSFALSDFLPYSSHISPHIVKLKGGSYLMCFALEGVSFVGKEIELIDNRVALINQAMMRLRAPARYNLYIHTHAIKSAGTAKLEDNFARDSFAEKLNNSYLDKVIYSKQIMQNRYYISVIYRAYKRFVGTKITTTVKDIAQHQKMAIEELGKVRERFLSEFEEYGIRCLSCFDKKDPSGNVQTYSEVLQFLNLLVNDSHEPLALMNAPIAQYLPTVSLSLGQSDVIRIERNGITQFASILSIVEFPSATAAGIIQAFLDMPWKMVVSQVFVPIDKQDAASWLRTEFKRASGSDESSESDLADLLNAREGVLSDNFVLGHYYFSAMLFADSPEALRSRVSEAVSLLSSCGFNVATNRLAKLHSFCAQFPGNIQYCPREAKVSSENVAQIMPFLIHNKGKATGNPWGSAVSMIRTINDEIFYFSFHDSEKNNDEEGKLAPGNTVISGQTGAGKTVLLSFLLAQAQRFNPPPQTIIFDMDLGSSVFVKAMNGKYSQIKLGEPTGFNPFHLPNTASTRSFLKELLMVILKNDGMPVSAKEANFIEEAIIHTLEQPKRLADIEAFSNFLPDGDNSVRQRLKPWTVGEYAWVFNNAEDNFSLDANVIGIDYTQFLDVPSIRTPILMYLFHRIEEMLDGRAFLISLDEAWKPLQDAEFQKFIEKKQRTIRKQNGVLILATQSPDDFYENVSPAIMGQVVTQIFLPNPSAKRETYLEKIGISEEEFEIIRTMPKASREFLVKYQGETTHCRLNLRGVKEVDVLSGSQARAVLADRLQQESPNDWLEKYYQELKS